VIHAQSHAGRQRAQATRWGGEKLLVEYLHKIAPECGDRRAARIKLSCLRPSNRRDHHIRVAIDGFSGLVNALEVELFPLPNDDILVFYPPDAHGLVESGVAKLCYLFADDPLLGGSRRLDRLADWFTLRDDFQAIVDLVAGLRSNATATGAANGPGSAELAPPKLRRKSRQALTPEWLARLEAGLAQTDISNFMRRHPVCRVVDDSPPRSLFTEFTVSVADLAATVVPGVDLHSNPCLFQYLTETFDRRMLASLVKPDGKRSTDMISINLNLETLLSNEFLAFEQKLFAARRGTIVIELKAHDILADVEAYLFVCRFVRSRAYQVCIDGLTHGTMSLFDRGLLGADYIKVNFSGDMFEGRQATCRQLAEVVEMQGRDRFILARVETPQALYFGQQAGVRYFQGFYVDELFAESEYGHLGSRAPRRRDAHVLR
jgi:EAL domain-containing protein (putative c-di-GMP-specific phosphodiesterase class I)